jgi:death on curing protein
LPIIKYLTVEHVRVLHDYGVRLSGMRGGVLFSLHVDRAKLESAISRPRQTAFGKPVHRGFATKAAALFHALIANHPFTDGNKRTAVLALQDFFWANGRTLLASDDELIELALRVADRGERKHEDLVKSLARDLKSLAIKISDMPQTPAFRSLRADALEKANSVRTLLGLPEDVVREVHQQLVTQRFPTG